MEFQRPDMYPYIWIEDDRFVGECSTTQDLLFITGDYRPERYSDNTGPAHEDFVAEEVMPTHSKDCGLDLAAG